MITYTLNILRPLMFFALAFIISVVLMPWLINLLRRLKMGKSIRDASVAPIMSAMHQAKAGTPTMGGIMIWVVALVLALGSELVCSIDANLCNWSFLSRGQTWLPIGVMVGAALVGLVDDYLNVRRLGAKSGGLRMRHRVLSYLFIAGIGAWWFFSKLDWHVMHVTFLGTFDISWLYIPFFILVVVATSMSVNEADGLDGLAGGTLMTAFGAYAIIAWMQGRQDLAVLCAAIIGALLGFLWFNVNPAKVFMGDTGAMSLGTVLAVVALMTNQPFLLLIIGLPFVLESLSVLIQIASKKLRGGKKVFKSAPLHHHLEASGWTEPQIVARAWMISFVCAGLGVIFALIDRL